MIDLETEVMPSASEVAMWQREESYANRMTEALSGKGDFWCAHGRSPRYDVEQQWAVFEAVQHAMAVMGVSDSDRWRIVERQVLKLLDNYASKG